MAAKKGMYYFMKLLFQLHACIYVLMMNKMNFFLWVIVNESFRNADADKDTQMMRETDTCLFKKQVQPSGVFGLKGRTVRDDIRAVLRWLKDCHEEESMALFSVVSGDRGSREAVFRPPSR